MRVGRQPLFAAAPQLHTQGEVRLRLLERARLEFLGFMLADPQPKLRYARRFPEDPGCTDLGNWERFEAEHPYTFTGMYQFWCRKPA